MKILIQLAVGDWKGVCTMMEAFLFKSRKRTVKNVLTVILTTFGFLNVMASFVYSSKGYSWKCTEPSGLNGTLRTGPSHILGVSPSPVGSVSVPSVVSSYNGSYTVVSIAEYAFTNCSELIEISIPNTVSNIGSHAFQYCSKLENVTLPTSLTRIGSYAFGSCRNLSSIDIPEGVSMIASRAFDNCDSLTTVTIPSSVTKLEDIPFAYCDNLVEINVAEDNPMYSSVNGMLLSKDGKTLISCPSGLENVIVPSGVKTIAKWAFLACYKLKDVTLPVSVTKIETDAFRYCGWYTIHATEGDEARIKQVILQSGIDVVPNFAALNSCVGYKLSLSDVGDGTITSMKVDKDVSIETFALTNGKSMDMVLRIENVADTPIKLRLPQGYVYETADADDPLTISAHSVNLVTITRIDGNTFLIGKCLLRVVVSQ